MDDNQATNPLPVTPLTPPTSNTIPSEPAFKAENFMPSIIPAEDTAPTSIDPMTPLSTPAPVSEPVSLDISGAQVSTVVEGVAPLPQISVEPVIAAVPPVSPVLQPEAPAPTPSVIVPPVSAPVAPTVAGPTVPVENPNINAW